MLPRCEPWHVIRMSNERKARTYNMVDETIDVMPIYLSDTIKERIVHVQDQWNAQRESSIHMHPLPAQ